MKPEHEVRRRGAMHGLIVKVALIVSAIVLLALAAANHYGDVFGLEGFAKTIVTGVLAFGSFTDITLTLLWDRMTGGRRR